MEDKTRSGEVADEVRAARQRAHAIIARSPVDDVRAAFDRAADLPATDRVRPSETGLVMVRGRIGGTGGRFNLGELPVTRAALRMENGRVGIGYVSGRNRDHAELAALADAMVQDEAWRPSLEAGILAPLEAAMQARKSEKGRKAAATKVDFFTMVRTREPK